MVWCKNCVCTQKRKQLTLTYNRYLFIEIFLECFQLAVVVTDIHHSVCVCVCVCVCVHMHSFWGCCLSTFQLFHRPSEDGRPCTQAAKNSHRHQAQFIVTQLPSSAGDRSGNLSANHRQHFSHRTPVLMLSFSACLVKNVHWFAIRAGSTEKYICTTESIH